MPFRRTPRRWTVALAAVVSLSALALLLFGSRLLTAGAGLAPDEPPGERIASTPVPLASPSAMWGETPSPNMNQDPPLPQPQTAPQTQHQTTPVSPPLPQSPLPVLQDPRILIEKSARRLTVFDGERPAKVYRVVTGEVPGDKRREGDRRTPEGDFYVCVKNPYSKFTLSLGLSYPDLDDADRGLREGILTPAQHQAIAYALRHRRQPPWNTPLGGEIMIHGGGANREGTLGCIGMDDDDIRELFPQIPVGTLVRIVP